VQRVPLGPGRSQIAQPVANVINARAPLARPRIPNANVKRALPRIAAPTVVVRDEDGIRQTEPHSEMDVEEDVPTIDREEADASLLNGEQEVEAMVGVENSEEEDIEEIAELRPAKVQRTWPEISTDRRVKCEKEVQAIREVFEDEVDMYDTTMVSEYAEEIFEYMCDLEVSSPPASVMLPC
jgi:hypothetical protein